MAFFGLLLVLTPLLASASVGDGSNYYVVSFSQPTGAMQKNEILNAGYDIVGYSSGFKYVVRASAITKLKGVKIDGAAITQLDPTASVAAELMKFKGRRDIVISLYPGENQDRMMERLLKIAPETKRTKEGFYIQAVDSGQVNQIGKLIGIRYVSEYIPSELANNRTAKIIGVKNTWDSLGYSGSNIVVAEADTGLDTGNLATIHPDLRGRVIGLSAWCDGTHASPCSGNPTGQDLNGHGTHVAGTLYGNGTLNASYKGMAYSSQLFLQSIGNSNSESVYPPPEIEDLFIEASAYGASVHSNSYGSGGYGGEMCHYSSDAQGIDNFVFDLDPNMTIVFSAGNWGSGPRTISIQSTAKNLISVGAVNGANGSLNVLDYSGRGPTYDGRIKPDLVAPGLNVKSTCFNASNQQYCLKSGTSMAAPAVAGAAALVYDYLSENRNYIHPSSALIKSILVAGADPLNTTLYGTLPNNNVGFGMVNLNKSLAIANGYHMDYSDSQDNLNTNDISSYTFEVTNSSVPLKVALVWTDPMCTDLFGTCDQTALIDDLDLKVTLPDGTWRNGNNLSVSPASADRKNNIEMVALDNPAIGTYTVDVSAFSVPTGSQNYALTVVGGFSSLNPVEIPLPLISNIQVYNVTQNNSIVSWMTDVPATSVVKYKLAGAGLGWSYVQDEGYNSTHALLLPSLIPNAEYIYTARSCNEQGGCAESEEYNFTTLSPPPASLVLSAISANSSNDSAIIIWTTSIGANSSVRYKANGNNNWIYADDSAMMTSHSIPIAALIPNTAYTYTVRSCVDASTCNESSEATFSTVANPTLNGLGVNPVTFNGATIQWSTNPTTNTSLTCVASGANTTTQVNQAGFSRNHMATLSNLQPTTVYTCNIHYCTNQSVCADRSGVSFMTRAFGEADIMTVPATARIAMIGIGLNKGISYEGASPFDQNVTEGRYMIKVSWMDGSSRNMNVEVLPGRLLTLTLVSPNVASTGTAIPAD